MSRNNLKHLTDIQLLALVKKSNEMAFTVLYDKYWEMLYAVTYRKTHSKEETEDILHEVFMDIWKNRKKLAIKSSLPAYLATAVKYKIFRRIHSAAIRKKHAEAAQQEKPMTVNSTALEVSFNELYHLIEESIERLPDKCKTVFRLSREENKTVKEIAGQLEISPNTVKNHVKHALSHLRLDLNDFLTIVVILFPF